MSTQGTVRAGEEAPAISIKHWRAFGPAEWLHVREGALGLVLGSLLPVVLFYTTFRLWGFSAAVVAVLGWSAAIFTWHRRRTGSADVFSATTFAFACIKATAGLVSQNPFLYLAWPSLENMIYGSAFLGSALLGTPLLALYAQRLYPIPASVRATPTFRRAFVVASAAWFGGHGLRAVVRVWLLVTLPLELYLIADTIAGWPINISLVAFTTWYPLRRLHQAGFMNVQPTHLSSIDTVELVVEETAPSTV
jgi:intracellular septation protein A